MNFIIFYFHSHFFNGIKSKLIATLLRPDSSERVAAASVVWDYQKLFFLPYLIDDDTPPPPPWTTGVLQLPGPAHRGRLRGVRDPRAGPRRHLWGSRRVPGAAAAALRSTEGVLVPWRRPQNNWWRTKIVFRKSVILSIFSTTHAANLHRTQHRQATEVPPRSRSIVLVISDLLNIFVVRLCHHK